MYPPAKKKKKKELDDKAGAEACTTELEIPGQAETEHKDGIHHR